MTTPSEQLARLYTPLSDAIARLETDTGRASVLPHPAGIPPARYAVFPR